jgi:hypothetical protein
MSRLIYATQVLCDGCGAAAALPAPSDDPGSVHRSPPGWLPTGLDMYDLQRTMIIDDLCGSCLQRPLAELLERQLAAAAETTP